MARLSGGLLGLRAEGDRLTDRRLRVGRPLRDRSPFAARSVDGGAVCFGGFFTARRFVLFSLDAFVAALCSE